MRTKEEMTHTLRKLRKLWMRYPQMALFDLVDSATEVRGDRDFIRTLGLYWESRAKSKKRLGRARV